MLTPGIILDGRYQIREHIGGGGFGSVYLAEDMRFTGSNRVAVKEILPRSETEARSLQLEADLLYKLSHPNLPKVSNYFKENGAYLIVMDYISGRDLSEKLKDGKVFEVSETLRIADAVLDALEYLHSFPVYHRDIKPHNIKIAENGAIYLLDFGTAKDTGVEDISVKAGQSITGFTPFYAPLEQVLRVDTNSYLMLQAEHPNHLEKWLSYKTDGRSDIYGLAATLFHLLTGTAPASATSTFRARTVWSGSPDPLPLVSDVNPSVSLEIAKVLRKAIEIEPADRFQNATEFRDELRRITRRSDEKTLPIGAVDAFVPEPTREIFSSRWTNESAGTRESLTERFDQQNVNSVVEVPRPKERQRGSRAIVWTAAGLAAMLFVVGIAAIAIWFVTRSTESAIETKPYPDTVTDRQKADVPVAVEPVRSLSYLLVVQKMRNGKEFRLPFESTGEDVFGNGDRFQMRITSPSPGFVYVFGEGINDRGEMDLNIVFPTPKRNDGSAEVSSGQLVETGWNQLEGSPGTERVWIIWAKDKSTVLEAAKENAFTNEGTVSDKMIREDLKKYLDENFAPATKSSVDLAEKLRQVEFSGDTAVYLMKLEHR